MSSAGDNKTRAPLAQYPTYSMTYVCGECGHDAEVKLGEPIRCRKCGYRILYKKRTKLPVQFEAR